MSRRRNVVVRAMTLLVAPILPISAALPVLAALAVPSVALAAPAEEHAAEAAPDKAAPEPMPSKTEQAKILAQDGRRLFWKGEYEAAIGAFAAAYAKAADPNLLFNISTAYEKLGDYDAAIEYLDRYGPDAPEDEGPAIAAKRLELEEAGRAPIAPDPAEDQAEPVPAVEPAPAPEEPKPQPLMGGLGWSLVGIAAGGLGVGIGLGASSLASSKAGREGCVETGGDLRCPESSQSSLDAARRSATIADIGFGVAIIAAAATLVVVGVRLRKRRQTESTDVSLHGLGALIRF